MPIWIILVFLIFLYLIWSEIGSQDCAPNRSEELVGYCINRVPPVTETMTTQEIINQIMKGLFKNHTLVGWRRAMIVALVSMVILCFLWQWPDGVDFTIGTLIIFAVVYTLIGYYQRYILKVWDDIVEVNLRKLRRQLK